MITEDTRGLAETRLSTILGMIGTRNAVRVDDLCAELHVSPATARRDLAELDRRGLVRKVHGGAVSIAGRLAEPQFEDKAIEAAEAKARIAREALSLVQPNDCIFLDGGSTVLALAQLLTDRHPLTIVTNSLRVAMAMTGAKPRLLLIGGELRRLSQTFVGPLTQPAMEHLHVDKAFMGTIGLSLEEGMTTTDPAEAFTKRLIMQHATQVILLADRRKFGKVAFAHAGGIQQLDILVTDGAADAHMERALAREGIEVKRAPEGATEE